MLEIDYYAYQNRWRTFPPLVKALIYIIILITMFFTNVLYQLFALIILALLTCYTTRIHFNTYCRWMGIPFLFLLISVITILLSFNYDKARMIFSLPIASFYIGITYDSIQIAKETFFRSLSCLAVTYLFVLTTPFDQLIYIGKKMRIPQALLELILLTYRFIFIVLDEMIKLKRAQTLRFGYYNLRTSYHSTGILITLLLERVLLRYKAMLITLDVKLYRGNFPI